MTSSSTPRTFRPAFTLVELLVVIGIIALLISILLPTLNKAREQGNRVKCLSNLKQLGVAFQLYTTDHRGWFPACAAGERPEDWIYWQAHRDVNQGAIVRYFGKKFSPAVYICPGDDVTGHLGGATGYRYSYSINYNMTGWPHPGPNWTRPPVKQSSIRQSSSKILMIDESSETIDDGAWAPQHYASDQRNLLSNRHDKRNEKSADPNFGRGNVLFADFHADFIERKITLDARHYDPRF